MNLKSWLRHIIICSTLVGMAAGISLLLTPLFWFIWTIGVGAAYVLIIAEVKFRQKKKEYYEQWRKEGLI